MQRKVWSKIFQILCRHTTNLSLTLQPLSICHEHKHNIHLKIMYNQQVSIMQYIYIYIYLCFTFNGHFPGGPGLSGTRMSSFWILLEPMMMEVVVTIEGLRERTEYIDIFPFSAHYSIMFCFRWSAYWWKGSVRFQCFKIILVKFG